MVKVNADHKGVVRDVNVRVFTDYPVSGVKPDKAIVTDKTKGADKILTAKIPPTILHRDVRRLVVLIPVEEQHGRQVEE